MSSELRGSHNRFPSFKTYRTNVEHIDKLRYVSDITQSTDSATIRRLINEEYEFVTTGKIDGDNQ